MTIGRQLRLGLPLAGEAELVLFGAAGFQAITEHVMRWPDRLWAIEGCSGIGRHVGTSGRTGFMHNEAA